MDDAPWHPPSRMWLAPRPIPRCGPADPASAHREGIPELNIDYIKILSDSQAAIKALNKPRITSQSVLTALEFMETLALEAKHLTLAWIKAHVGTEGNEQADQAAKEGAGK